MSKDDLKRIGFLMQGQLWAIASGAFIGAGGWWAGIGCLIVAGFMGFLAFDGIKEDLRP